MDHHSPGFGDYNSDGSLSWRLPLSSNSRVFDGLEVVCQVFDVGLALEDAIVSVVGLDVDSVLHGHPFEVLLGYNRVTGVESDLVLDMEVHGGCIVEHRAAAELVALSFSSGGVEEPATNSRLQLITEDETPWSELAGLGAAHGMGILDSGGGAVRLPSLLSVLAGSASRVVRNSGAQEPQGKTIEETAKTQLLNMSKREMTELVVPKSPHAL